MARQLRVQFPDALYHVTSRGNNGEAIFKTNEDRILFLSFLGVAAKRFGWSISGWVLMTNHFHLVIQTPNANLSRGMHWLNGKYAARFNRTHRRRGHLFQGRFHSVLIQKESYFREVLRYVVLNPVRAKMVRRAENYRWSSYRATVGLESAPDWLDVAAALASFGNPEEAQALYGAFVNEVRDGERLWENLTNSIFLGTEDWARAMRKEVEAKPRSTDFPLKQRAVGRPKMAHIVSAIAENANVSRNVLHTRGDRQLRRLAAWIGWHEGLLTLRSIAAGLRLRSEGHISSLIRRCDRELSAGGTLLDTLDAVIASLRAIPRECDSRPAVAEQQVPA
jgi:putative transposase